MLYYIAISEEGGRIGQEIKSFFDLSQFIPDQEEIKHAEGSLSGKNKELLQTVSDSIKDDVLVVQESLDLFIRNKSAQVEEMEPLLDNLQNIADTLGILGLGVARDSVIVHQEQLKTAVTDKTRPTDDELLDVAKTLLMIESQLGDHIQSLGTSEDLVNDDDNPIPKSEQRAILQQLAKESIINLQQIKTNFVAFIESPWDKNQVKDNPRLLKDIAGALKILNLSEAGNHLDEIIEYVNADILGRESKPSALQLEQLATVISSLEYYLENLDQGQRIRTSLLAEVATQIEQLKHQVAHDIEHLESVEEQAEDNQVEEGSELESDQVEDAEETVAADEDDSDTEVMDSGEDDSDTESDDGDQPEEVAEDSEPEEQVAVSESAKPLLMVDFGDDVDDEIKEVFLEEFEEELGNMQEKHATWKEDPEAHTEELTEIRRIFHTLKGSGRLVGAEAIGEFGWMMESMCNRLLEGGIKHSSDFRDVLQSGVVMSAGLFSALQNKSAVPDGYDLLLVNAGHVANNAALETEPEVIETTEEVVEDQVEEVAEDQVEEVAEDQIEEVAEDQVEEVAEDQAEATAEDAAEDQAEEMDESTGSDDDSDEDDLSLDYVQYDIEEAVAESKEDSTEEDESEEVAELDVEDDEDLTLDFTLDDGTVVTASDDDEDGVDLDDVLDTADQVEEIDLDESEIFDLEAELAEFEGDESTLLDEEMDESADDETVEEEFNLDEFDLDLELEEASELDDADLETDDETEILLSLADEDEASEESEETSVAENGYDLDVDPV
ncbi:MAG: Hpt domain-containing protein, partial [Marinicella sp.]